jgi:hypothetical protein
MHAVINHLSLHKTTDWPALARLFQAFDEKVRAEHPHFRGGSLIRVGDDHAIVVIAFETREALDDVSKNLAAPWFAKHVRPLLAGAVSRSVGEVIAGSALR